MFQSNKLTESARRIPKITIKEDNKMNRIFIKLFLPKLDGYTLICKRKKNITQ